MELIKINEDIAEDLCEHGSRLFNIKHCFNLFLDCLENDNYNENPVEILCFGLILKEYFNITKTKFNELEDLLKIDRL